MYKLWFENEIEFVAWFVVTDTGKISDLRSCLHQFLPGQRVIVISKPGRRVRVFYFCFIQCSYLLKVLKMA